VTLPKHFRESSRYLAVELATWADADLDRGSFQRHLWYAAQNLLGDAGSARVDLQVLRFRFSDGDGEAVVRTRPGEVGPARAVLACLDDVDDEPLGLRVRGVSGTVRACEEKYLGRRREESEERNVAYRGERRPATVRGDRVDLRGQRRTGATRLDSE
jgi:ribonuclease P/MRP protein subunit POP5